MLLRAVNSGTFGGRRISHLDVGRVQSAMLTVIAQLLRFNSGTRHASKQLCVNVCLVPVVNVKS